jgi:hypothetical protein
MFAGSRYRCAKGADGRLIAFTRLPTSLRSFALWSLTSNILLYGFFNGLYSLFLGCFFAYDLAYGEGIARCVIILEGRKSALLSLSPGARDAGSTITSSKPR